jgi:hypothetical protein
MPVSAWEFSEGSGQINEIERFLRAHPDTGYSLHEIEAAIIGDPVDRTRHLDLFIADLLLLVPRLFEEERIECRVIEGIPYFKWND